jgi:hypothetical protein
MCSHPPSMVVVTIPSSHRMISNTTRNMIILPLSRPLS